MGDVKILDILALAIVAISFVTALVKGLVRELIALAAAVSGLLLAVYYFAAVSPLLERFGIGTLLSELLAFVGIFLGCIIAGSLLSSLLNRFISALNMTWIDRFLGGVFGLLRGWLIVAVIFLALTVFPIRNDLVSGTVTGEYFLVVTRKLVELSAPPSFRERFQTEYERIYRYWLQRAPTGNREKTFPAAFRQDPKADPHGSYMTHGQRRSDPHQGQAGSDRRRTGGQGDSLAGGGGAIREALHPAGPGRDRRQDRFRGPGDGHAPEHSRGQDPEAPYRKKEMTGAAVFLPPLSTLSGKKSRRQESRLSQRR